ncbi:MAG: NUDIX hydrolase [Mobilicoccus sp.]|nr:NUDIX hydrolase [Mobilicoccus sp.]
MSLDAPRLRGVDLVDEYAPRPVRASRTVYEGMVWDVQRDTVDLGEAVVDREYIAHPGAVAIVALRAAPEAAGHYQVLLIKQYRHPIGAVEWEIPAGLLDVEGESLVAAAQRELAEEADLRAGQWDTLVDIRTSPGALSESIRIFVARELDDVPADDRHVREAEEAGMTRAWVDLDEAYSAVLAGRVSNVSAVVGILAAYGAKRVGWVTLRAPDAPGALDG